MHTDSQNAKVDQARSKLFPFINKQFSHFYFYFLFFQLFSFFIFMSLVVFFIPVFREILKNTFYQI